MSSSVPLDNAVELVRLVQRRTLSPLTVAEAVVDRINQFDGVLNAFCHFDESAFLASAAELDRRQRAGDDLGPLAGLPVGIKDLIFVRDMPCVAGSAAFEGFVPDVDDISVARLRSAGALIVGKTNVPELGFSGTCDNSVFGSTRNPWNTELTSGGSSGGSAAAVAAGLVPAALGSDAAGSIRTPASFCGIVGVKASMGRVPLFPGCRDPRYPGLSSFETTEHIGPMTRSVGDSALLLSVLAGPDPRDRFSLPSADFDWRAAAERRVGSLRIGYLTDMGYAAPEPAVRAVTDRAVERIAQALDCVVEPVLPPWPNPETHLWAFVAGDTDMVGLAALIERYGERMAPHLHQMIEYDWKLTEFTEARKVRQELVMQMAGLMSRYDVIITPTNAVPPFPVGRERPDGYGIWSPYVLPMNLTGQPALTIPAGFTDSGLPIGIQVAAGHLQDELLLGAAATFEAVLDWDRQVVPALPGVADSQ